LYFLNTVSAEFEPETLAAYQNAGMKAVVRQKDMLYRHGRYWDRLMMGILQEEWLNKAERE
jgi:RimJ/RimL family protein N-acetyltransferase